MSGRSSATEVKSPPIRYRKMGKRRDRSAAEVYQSLGVQMADAMTLQKAVWLLVEIQHRQAVNYTPGPVHGLGSARDCDHPTCAKFKELLGDE